LYTTGVSGQDIYDAVQCAGVEVEPGASWTKVKFPRNEKSLAA